MVLAIHSNALYLFEPKSRSRAGGQMYMAGKEEIPINGAVLNISQIILGAIFINVKTTISMRQTVIKLGHRQPRTATAHALLTTKILPKALKAMDM